jgi:hypothetical protein
LRLNQATAHHQTFQNPSRAVSPKSLANQRRCLAVVLADDFLDEADKGTPQFGVADLRERPDQF